MSRTAYVNGSYLPHRLAAVHVEDRGYQFSDGVYEVIAVRRGHLVDEDIHFDRLDRSLAEVGIPAPLSRKALKVVTREVVRRNRVRTGIVYMQITRGVARRDHAFPAAASASLVLTARSQRPKRALAETGVRVITVPDQRWKRRDIKSISLLPNVLARQQAAQVGAYEAWQVEEDGSVTEGTASNAWIVTKNGELVTRQADHAILNGVTRRAVIALSEQHEARLVERTFTVEEALSAREAFLTSTSSDVIPVVQIDDRVIANGQPGSLTRALLALYADHAAGAS